jgi:hypothetical protein
MLHSVLRRAGFAKLETAFAKLTAGASLAVLAGHWFLVTRFVAARAGQGLGFLRLHYSVTYGLDWVGPWWYVFAYPAAGLACFVLNLWLADRLSRVRPALGTLALVATFLLQLLFAAGGVTAVLLNG